MSEDGHEERAWRFYVGDMIEFCEKALSYTNGLDQAAFVADKLVYDATLRNLELIGEAATHVPEEVCKVHPEIPWRQVIGTRNRLAHSYLAIDNDTIWDIIQTDVPEILPKLRDLRDSIREDSS